EVELLGVCTVAGNQTLAKTTANALRVLEHLGRDDIPVAAGAARPLVREPRVAAQVHGESGLDGPDLPPPAGAPVPEHAIEWIAATLAAQAEPVTLVPTGPLTNIALFLARYPELAPKVARIVLMGGAVGLGNVTPAAEFNIWADPEAASRVFSSGREVTMVGLDVTHKALMRDVHVEQLAHSGAAGKLVADLHRFYAQHHKRRYGWDGAPVHDAVAVGHVLDPTLLELCRCAVKVDTGPEISRGRTYADVWGVTDWPRACDVAVDIDADRFLELLLARITSLG
ncbi:MAG TPA: nucleoside hydrolase, partial [Solirubrobacteraceae bacterium]|nr:nucleoside hydrolase [Solirubrobacteraceae bacterium]